MLQLTPTQAKSLRAWFMPERPGPLVGMHVLQTGNGKCYADRWPDPRAVLVESGENYALAGDPHAFDPTELHALITGFVAAPEQLAPLLHAAFPDLQIWDRVIFELQTNSQILGPHTSVIRPLQRSDVFHLQEWPPELNWISKTWNGPAGLAASGYAWGAFVDERLASVACTFYLGEQYEDLGVVTEPEFRGLGLSAACAASLCAAIQKRGRRPSWSTSPDNRASMRVAEKLDFSLHRRDFLYVTGVQIPEPARRTQLKEEKS